LAYLHDELNGTDEEGKELEEVVLLLLLHSVVTVLLAAGKDLGFRKTNTGVGLEHVFGDLATTTGGLLFFLLELVTILGLEVLDQGVNVLIFLLILNRGLGGLLGSNTTLGRDLLNGALLVEAARLDVGVERRCANTLVVSHG
jgi:hypothetical protein